jgi:hypothetical protein
MFHVVFDPEDDVEGDGEQGGSPRTIDFHAQLDDLELLDIRDGAPGAGQYRSNRILDRSARLA